MDLNPWDIIILLRCEITLLLILLRGICMEIVFYLKIVYFDMK